MKHNINGDIISDVAEMHRKFEVNKTMDILMETLSREDLLKYLNFRLDMCQEELTETRDAVEARDAEEVVDGLIDLIVFAAGTLDVMNIDTRKAWKAVMEANMNKNPGVKPGRPNPLGFPDMIKPSDWVGPSHIGNHGYITEILGEEK